MNRSFPNLHIRKYAIKYSLAAGLLTIVLFFAVASRANWPVPQELVAGFQQKIDGEDVAIEVATGEAILNSTLGV